MDAIQTMIKPLGVALGVKYTEPAKSKALPDDLYVDDVLRMIGGNGIMVDKHGNK